MSAGALSRWGATQPLGPLVAPLGSFLWHFGPQLHMFPGEAELGGDVGMPFGELRSTFVVPLGSLGGRLGGTNQLLGAN